MNTFVPPEIIEDILQKTDIVQLISEYLQLKKQGKNFVGLCPFHSEDTPSFSVSPEKQIFYCFGCQKGGNSVNFVMEMEGLSLPEAALKLAEKVGIIIPEKEYSPAYKARNQEKQRLLQIHELAADFYKNQLQLATNKAGAAYCAKRGITKESIRTFGIGFAPPQDWQALAKYLQDKGYDPQLIEKAGLIGKSAKTGAYYDKFHSRLIFPNCDYKGQIIAFGGRMIGDDQPKYLNSTQTPIYNKSQNLYALHIAGPAIRHNDLAIVMEGYMDVVMAHQYGVTNAVASLGTALTPQQARLLKRYTTNVILAYDGDSAGARAAQRGLEIMGSEGINIRILPLPSGADPDSFLRKFGKKGWDELVARKTLGVLEYLLWMAEAKYPQKTVTDKGLIIKELMPAIIKTNSHVEKDSFIRLLASRLEVSAETVYADLVKNGLKIKAPAKEDKAATKTVMAKAPSIKAINPLFNIILQDKDAFDKLLKETGYGFCQNEGEKELVQFVQSLADTYDWQIITLLHILPPENEGLRQLLLNLLQAEFPSSDYIDIIDDWIKSYRLHDLQDQIKNLSKKLSKKPENAKDILKQISILQQRVQKLKS